jgi:cytochrome bd-type quinol oxidase subunit 2
MLFLHGAAWLSMKTEYGIVRDRARAYAPLFAFASIVLFALAGAWVAFGDIGYQVTNTVAADGPSNPRLTETVREGGAWLSNYGRYPWMLIAPVLGFGGAALALFGLRSELRGADLCRLQAVGGGHHLHGGRVDVPVHPALQRGSKCLSLTVWNARPAIRPCS